MNLTLALLLAAAAPSTALPVPAPTGAKAAEARKAVRYSLEYEAGLPYAKGDAKKEVHDCAELDAALAAGMTNASEARPDFEAAARLEATCSELAFLAGAKPAGKSYVKDFKLDESAPSMLPPCFDRMAEPDFLKLESALAKSGTSWKAMAPGLEVEEGTRDRLTVKGTTVVTRIAAADLDGDRTEDLLLEVAQHADGGTGNVLWWLALTRGRGEKMLRVIKDSMGVCEPTVKSVFTDCTGDRVDEAIAQAGSSKDAYGSLAKFRASCKGPIPPPFRDRLSVAIANSAHAKGDDDACRKALEGVGDDEDVYAPDIAPALDAARSACPPTTEFH